MVRQDDCFDPSLLGCKPRTTEKYEAYTALIHRFVLDRRQEVVALLPVTNVIIAPSLPPPRTAWNRSQNSAAR